MEVPPKTCNGPTRARGGLACGLLGEVLLPDDDVPLPEGAVPLPAGVVPLPAGAVPLRTGGLATALGGVVPPELMARSRRPEAAGGLEGGGIGSGGKEAGYSGGLGGLGGGAGGGAGGGGLFAAWTARRYVGAGPEAREEW